MGRTIIVGDIHGCRDELSDLLEACAFAGGDRVIAVGDLVAKGPDSRGVIEMARTLGIVAVLGNHDAHVLRLREARAGDERARKRQHHFEVAQALGGEDIAYLAELPLWLRLADADPVRVTLVVHAGLVPGVPLERQEPETCLNLRSFKPDGTPSKRIEGTAWAARWPGPERVVFGHDAVRGLQQHRFATGLDTGCVYGGRLTALVLPDERLVSVPARRVYRPLDAS
jgi:hypothetical protein